MRRVHNDATRGGRTWPVGWIAVAAVVLACTLAPSAQAQPIGIIGHSAGCVVVVVSRLVWKRKWRILPVGS